MSSLLVYASEKELQETLVRAAKLTNWLVFHAFDSRRSEPGFPDLVMVRDGRLLFFELKQQRGRVQPRQQWWLDKLADVPGVTATVVRPIPKPGELSYDDAIELIGRLP